MDKFACEECGGTYESKTELEAHMKRDHAIQPSETTTAGQPTKRD